MSDIDYSRTEAVVCFIVEDVSVLLAEKGRNIGKGKLVGVGGRQEAGETLDQTAHREALEEIGIRVRSKREAAKLDFVFPHNPRYSQRVTAYIVDAWEGIPRPSDEAKTIGWFRFDELPISRMWHDNTIWLPLILSGKCVRGRFSIGEDDRVTEYNLEEVGGLE